MIEKNNFYDILIDNFNERMRKMKKEKKQQEKIKKTRNYDKGQIFVKVMAGILAILMIVATASSLIYALMI